MLFRSDPFMSLGELRAAASTPPPPGLEKLVVAGSTSPRPLRDGDIRPSEPPVPLPLRPLPISGLPSVDAFEDLLEVNGPGSSRAPSPAPRLLPPVFVGNAQSGDPFTGLAELRVQSSAPSALESSSMKSLRPSIPSPETGLNPVTELAPSHPLRQRGEGPFAAPTPTAPRTHLRPSTAEATNDSK